MLASIICDHGANAQRIRDVLLRAGLDCPAGCIVSLEAAQNRVPQISPGLVVLALTPDPERALTMLAALRQSTASPLLVVGPTADPRCVLRALRGGANDFIDEAEMAVDLPAAIERVRQSSTAQKEPARTIVVLAPSGGSGSSTLAANVATSLARHHKSALLVDLKLQSGDLAALMDVKPTHTLADLCQNVGRLDRVMFERSLAHHASGVQLIAPPRSLADIAYITVEGVRQVLNLGRSIFPYVVVDLDHSFGAEQTQVLQQADVILLVLRLDFTCLRNARRTLEFLDQTGVNRDRVRIVINRYGQAKELPAAKAEEVLGLKIAHYVPEDAKSVNRANNNGVPVVLDSPSAKVSKSLTHLAESVNGRHHG